MHSVWKAALEYLGEGLAPVPIMRGTKQPPEGVIWSRWHDRPPSTEELQEAFAVLPLDKLSVGIIGGRASGGLFVLDADTPERWQDVCNRLAEAGIDTRKVQRPANGSDHDGGGHIWFTAPVAVASCKPFPDLDIQGQGALIVAPPSEHSGGGCYAFLDTDTPIYQLRSLDQLPWLRLTPASPGRPTIPAKARALLAGADDALLSFYIDRTTRDPLTPEQALALGDQAKLDRSMAEAAICASLVGAGRTFEDALDLFETYPAAGKFAERLQKQGHRQARRYLRSLWDGATAYVESQGNPHAERARELRSWAMSYKWPGRSARYDRPAYLAHLDIVERSGNDPHGASVREVAELAGISWRAATSAHRRLIAAGFLEVTRQNTPSHATRYKLTDKPESEVSTVSSTPVSDCEGSRAVSGTPELIKPVDCARTRAHDAFRYCRGGLCKAGLDVWLVLSATDQALHYKTIAELANCSSGTVRHRKLPLMFELGMVTPEGNGFWRAVPDVSLDQVSRDLGTFGKGASDKCKHQRERNADRRTFGRQYEDWKTHQETLEDSE